MSAEDQFRLAIEAAGLTPPDVVIGDGRLHRFATSDRRRDDAGYYSLHLDGTPAGIFGCWRTGLQSTWSARPERELTPAERRAQQERIRAAQRERDAEAMRRQDAAAAEALATWSAAQPVAEHPYLTAKAVAAHGLRTDGERLLIPMRDAAGRLWSLQTIGADGSKRFLTGGRVKGCYHAIGRPSGTVLLAEGYATAATCHAATGHAAAVTFNAGNLLPVARALRAKYPCLSIIVAADDDWRTEGNPGLTAAREAALAVGGKVAVPDFTGLERGDKDTDFNDLARLAAAAQKEVAL